MELTYDEAFFGKTVNVTVARERLCHTCGATGSAKPEEMPTVSHRVMVHAPPAHSYIYSAPC